MQGNSNADNTIKLIKSWINTEGNVNSMDGILLWIQDITRNTHVSVKEVDIDDDDFWFYDEYRGEILNRKSSFFTVSGLRYFVDEQFVKEQPIIVQPEIGYLGIIAKEINGVVNFLMQAKIEPGNVNYVQISPTIQATKSNFTRAHGGRLPLYFDYFENSRESGTVIYDQIQSEQGGRFDGKRNRNIIILVDKDVPEYPNFKWMTLGQIKSLMKIDNLVNMDTRTVLSGIPIIFNNQNKDEFLELRSLFSDETLFNSIKGGDCTRDLSLLHSYMNDYKMYHEIRKIRTPLNQLVEWKIDSRGLYNDNNSEFDVKFYSIEIEGREIRRWTQPLFRAKSIGLFVLFTTVIDGIRKYLINLSPEIGCFDMVEYGPSIQMMNYQNHKCSGYEQMLFEVFDSHIDKKEGILCDVVLSEEGGRFFHEQNRNVIVDIDANELINIPEGSFWADYRCLNEMMQSNNCLNIQLRNLISLIDI